VTKAIETGHADPDLRYKLAALWLVDQVPTNRQPKYFWSTKFSDSQIQRITSLDPHIGVMPDDPIPLGNPIEGG